MRTTIGDRHQGCLATNGLCERYSPIWLVPKVTREISLSVRVDDQHVPLRCCGKACEMTRHRGLENPTLPVYYQDRIRNWHELPLLG